METTAREIGLASQQCHKTIQFLLVAQRVAVAVVQFRDLVKVKSSRMIRVPTLKGDWLRSVMNRCASVA